MFFLLQDESGCHDIDIDVRILKEQLDLQKYVHGYNYTTLADLKIFPPKEEWKDAVPVGTLEFVQTWLKKYRGISEMNPIEVPACLRTKRALHRDYRIVKGADVPTSGRYFIKGVDKLKDFSFTGDVSCFHIRDDAWIDMSIKSDSIYQVSEVITIMSEWRVFVHDGEVVACINYDGVPDIFPDRSTIAYLIGSLSIDKEFHDLRAYTLDLAVTSDGDTVILEVHPWVSVGLYGYMFGSELPYCYRDGLDWYLDHNTKTPLTE